MDYAKKCSCDILYKPQDTKYAENIRKFQGCPTIAVTGGGRIYLGWYAGGTTEPHMENYNLLVFSDDQGMTWSDPLLVIPSNYEKGIHALDIQLFMDPDGTLHVCWVQNNAVPVPEKIPVVQKEQPICINDGYLFCDFRHAEWEMICREPDAKEPVFTEPHYLFPGFLRCKPTFLQSGRWLYFNYDQLEDAYAYSYSDDRGKSFVRRYGAVKEPTCFDETMAYQRTDGSIRMLARSHCGELAESCSYDDGATWTKTVKSGIVAADTRFFVTRLPSGRIILINNDDGKKRAKMTVQLSEDDGKTWKYKKCIDEREELSYPDADIRNDRICLTYDRGRTSHREILFTSFTEQDILEKKEIAVSIVSRPDRSDRQ